MKKLKLPEDSTNNAIKQGSSSTKGVKSPNGIHRDPNRPVPSEPTLGDHLSHMSIYRHSVNSTTEHILTSLPHAHSDSPVRVVTQRNPESKLNQRASVNSAQKSTPRLGSKLTLNSAAGRAGGSLGSPVRISPRTSKDAQDSGDQAQESGSGFKGSFASVLGSGTASSGTTPEVWGRAPLRHSSLFFSYLVVPELVPRELEDEIEQKEFKNTDKKKTKRPTTFKRAIR